MTEIRDALVVGVSGIAGSAVANHLHREGVPVVGLSRGRVHGLTDVDQRRADLEDRASIAEALGDRSPSHVYITVWKRHNTEAENIRVNGLMIRNLMDVLGERGGVEHVSLLTGLKHYIGSPNQQGEIAPSSDTPFDERAPRLPVENFYYAQEDAVFDAAERQGFTWSVHRSHTIVGASVGNAMNMFLTIAVYAAICRELGKPFIFPGSEVRWNALGDVTDSRILAAQMIWASTTPAARNEAFNTVNGDFFRWRTMWPRIAEMLGVEPEGFNGEVRPMQTLLADAAPIWKRIADKHNLIEDDLDRVASPWHTDGDLGRKIEIHADSGKARELGFTDFVRSERSFRDLFAHYSAAGVIPPVPVTGTPLWREF
ncbi:SDR family oxidoreductase [Ruicaihuangia caeni]|uniref:SDR family oxidoreductase n=1 Tax=Ruicaihuangia caeni TaxID=3042517 RepID=UPI00338D63C8